MRDLIARKRDGHALDAASIRGFIALVASGGVPDYQTAALLMAILWRGLNERELDAWARAMIDSGERLHLRGVPGPKIDKHSTGGVGDKVTLPLAPLVAACGVRAPLITGRALGHSGGTMDKIESIPGFRTELGPRALERILRRAGFFIAGQTPRLVPADRVLYALRDATSTVESIPLMAASIVSKKVAAGADALVMDVKVGRGAFLPERRRARALAHAIVTLARRLGLPARALLTDMDQPLGREIGNALEVKESIELLRGAGPPDTRALTMRLGAEMLLAAGVAKTRSAAAAKLEAAITSGAAFEHFVLGVRLQGGDPRAVERPERLPRARRQRLVRAAASGVVVDLDARRIGDAATRLGAGRLRKEDRIDPGVGITLHCKRGEPVSAGEALATLWYNDQAKLRSALALVEEAFQIGSTPPRRRSLVLEIIDT